MSSMVYLISEADRAVHVLNPRHPQTVLVDQICLQARNFGIFSSPSLKDVAPNASSHHFDGISSAFFCVNVVFTAKASFSTLGH